MALITSGDYQGKSNSALASAGSGAQGIQDMGAGFMNDYRSTYAPIAGQVLGMNDNTQGRVDQAATDVGLSYGKSKGILNRNMSRMGISPESGRFRGLQQQWGLARAAAEAGGKTRARRASEKANLDRLLSVARLGQQLPGLALNATVQGTAAQRGVSSDYGQIAGEEAALGAYENEQTQAQVVSPAQAAMAANERRRTEDARRTKEGRARTDRLNAERLQREDRQVREQAASAERQRTGDRSRSTADRAARDRKSQRDRAYQDRLSAWQGGAPTRPKMDFKKPPGLFSKQHQSGWTFGQTDISQHAQGLYERARASWNAKRPVRS